MSKNKRNYLEFLQYQISKEVLWIIGLYTISVLLDNPLINIIVYGIILSIVIQIITNRLQPINDESFVKELQDERKQILKKLEGEQSISDIILLNLNQINEYYRINQNQAKNSFRLSILLLLVGFCTIIFSILSVLYPNLSSNQNINISIISGISGIIVQFIGGVNFIFYNKAVSQLNIYYHQLIKAQDTMLAIELCNKIQPPEQKSKLTEKLIVTLIERSSMLSNSDSKTKKFSHIENKV